MFSGPAQHSCSSSPADCTSRVSQLPHGCRLMHLAPTHIHMHMHKSYEAVMLSGCLLSTAAAAGKQCSYKGSPGPQWLRSAPRSASACSLARQATCHCPAHRQRCLPPGTGGSCSRPWPRGPPWPPSGGTCLQQQREEFSTTKVTSCPKPAASACSCISKRRHALCSCSCSCMLSRTQLQLHVEQVSVAAAC